MYDILFSDLARKQLHKLDRGTQERIIAVLERIRIRPEAYISKLIGETAYKARVGDYRLILDLDKGNLIVLVIKIGHRSKIYK